MSSKCTNIRYIQSMWFIPKLIKYISIINFSIVRYDLQWKNICFIAKMWRLNYFVNVLFLPLSSWWLTSDCQRHLEVFCLSETALGSFGEQLTRFPSHTADNAKLIQQGCQRRLLTHVVLPLKLLSGNLICCQRGRNY